MDSLFSQPVVCQFRASDVVNSSKKDVNVTVEVVCDSSTQKKELVVRLTDDADPFFLYALRLGEDDFVSLKTEQGLLVDFGAFPQKLVELLRLCLSEQNAEVPRYVLQLANSVHGGVTALGQSSSSASGQPMLMNFVETNPFKHLVHLALRVMPAGDRELKRYLAECLKTSKQDTMELRRQLGRVTESLGGQLASAQQTLAVRTAEVERLRSDGQVRDSEITHRYERAIEEEREKATTERLALQQRFDRDRETWEQAHAKIVRELEGRHKEAAGDAKELSEKYHSLKLSVREWQSKASNFKEELDVANRELVAVKKEVTTLTADRHQLEKEVERLRTKLDGLVEQLRDKEAGLVRCQQLVDAERDQKHGFEEALEQTRAQLAKQESAVKHLKAEVRKANEVIPKLHEDNRNLREKVRLGLEVAQAQETKLKDADINSDQLKRNIVDLNSQVTMKEDQLKLLRREIEDLVSQKEDLKKQLDTNENMIGYLNKQLIERQLLGNYQNTPPMSVSSASSSQRSSLKRVTFQAGDELSNAMNLDGLADDLPQVSPVPKLDDRARLSPSGLSRPPLADKNLSDQPLDAKYFQPASSAAGAGQLRRSSQSASTLTSAPPAQQLGLSNQQPLLSRHIASVSSSGSAAIGRSAGTSVPSNQHAYFATPASSKN